MTDYQAELDRINDSNDPANTLREFVESRLGFGATMWTTNQPTWYTSGNRPITFRAGETITVTARQLNGEV